MTNYKIKSKGGLPTFPIASIFVDKFMPKANPTFVKVYLYGLRLCYATGEEITDKGIASALDILESDVILAWKYWQKQGVITRNEDGIIEFIDLSLLQEQEKKERPSYKTKELTEAISGNRDVELLLEHAENIFGKTFSFSEAGILFGFYDWLGLPIEVILILLEYVASLEKANIRYAEKVAIAWSEKGINTIEKANDYIENWEDRAKLSRKYKRMFGITNRNLSDAEYAHIVQWTDNMKMPPELIKEAYEKAVLSTGSASFPYINAILQSWYRKGVKTVSDIEKLDAKPVSPIIKRKKNRFTDYEQSGEYDYEELENRAKKKK